MLRTLVEFYLGGVLGAASALLIVISEETSSIKAVLLGSGLTCLGLMLGGVAGIYGLIKHNYEEK